MRKNLYEIPDSLILKSLKKSSVNGPEWAAHALEESAALAASTSCVLIATETKEAAAPPKTRLRLSPCRGASRRLLTAQVRDSESARSFAATSGRNLVHAGYGRAALREVLPAIKRSEEMSVLCRTETQASNSANIVVQVRSAESTPAGARRTATGAAAARCSAARRCCADLRCGGAERGDSTTVWYLSWA
eukprot:1586194-Pleurochrysis_carterae.AAC.6